MSTMNCAEILEAERGPAGPCPKHGTERFWQRAGYKNGKMQFRRRCNDCHRESLATDRQKHGGAAARNKVWESQNRAKALAHSKVAKHLKAGNIIRHPCERCGSLDVHAHHDNYAHALEIRWLCPIHHAERHRELAAMAESEAA